MSYFGSQARQHSMCTSRHSHSKVIQYGQGYRKVEGMLDEFVKLAHPSTTDNDVLKFARRFGALELCRQHCAPLHHVKAAPSRKSTCDELSVLQPVEAYRKWAREARLAVELALRAHDRAARRSARPLSSIVQKDYEKLYPIEPRLAAHYDRLVVRQSAGRGDRSRLQANVERGDARSLQSLMSRWLNYADIDLLVRFDGHRPRFVLGGNGAWAILGLNLALTVCACSGLAVCSKCGGIFPPRRSRRPNQENDWCENAECKKAAKAAAQRAHTGRRRSDVARRRSAKGGRTLPSRAIELQRNPRRD
jgi:hypothetical protein